MTGSIALVGATTGLAALSTTSGVATAMKAVVRGNPVTVSVTFKNPDGTPITVDSANLYIHYNRRFHSRETETVEMTVSGSAWSATWDTSQAESGDIYWSAQAVKNGAAAAAVDGMFMLTANSANPSPEIVF